MRNSENLENNNEKNFEENKPERSNTNTNQTKIASEFHFFNKLCIRAFLPNYKKSFIFNSEKILDRKLSFENILEMDIKFRVMKNLFLEEEESKLIEKIPLFKLNDHLTENYKL